MTDTRPPRHSRVESSSSSFASSPGSLWLPPFGAHMNKLLAEASEPTTPLSFVPIDWLQTTFPNVEPVKGGKLEGYVLQLRRTMKDLSKSREVLNDHTLSHSFVLHSLEGMVEAYLGLLEAVREMCKFSEAEIRGQEKEDRMTDLRQGVGGGAPTGANGTMIKQQSLPLDTAGGHNKNAQSMSLNGGGNGTRLPTVISPTSSTTPSTPRSDAGAADVRAGMESPYTPQTYRETPPPAMRAQSATSEINTSGSSTSSAPSSTSSTPSSAASVASPASNPSSKQYRTKRMSDLHQDHTALLSVKKHCIRTLRALRNVHVLVSAVDTLKDILSDHEFQAARVVFQAITEIFNTLSLYSKLPLIRALNEHVEAYKGMLRKEIFHAFREYLGQSFGGDGLSTPGSTTPNSPSSGGQAAAATQGSQSAKQKQIKQHKLNQLHHCCRLIDSLYSNIEKKELVKWFCTVQLQSYNQLVARKTFGDLLNPHYDSNGHLTGFDSIEKQFQWLFNELGEMYDREWSAVFPQEWYVDAIYTRRWFELVRQQFVLTLDTQEQRVRDENETRRALAEAKKARAIMKEMNKQLHHSGSSGSLRDMKGGGGGNGGRASARQSVDMGQGGGKKGQQQHDEDDDDQDDQPHANGHKTLPHSESLSALSTDIPGDSAPVQFDFYRPLLKTIEFENTIRARWLNEANQDTLSEDDLFVVLGNVPNPALQEAEKQQQAQQANGDGPSHPSQSLTPKNPPPYPFRFGGYISSAFHLYLPHMLLSERTRFYDFLEKVDEAEDWDVESAEISTCHFNDATKLFVMIQKSMERYSKVMPAGFFLDLFKEYRTSISNYLELLSKHLPDGGLLNGATTGASASSTTVGATLTSSSSSSRLEDGEVSSVCATINTSDYVLDRCTSLASTIIQMLYGKPYDEEQMDEEELSFLGILKEQVDLSSIEESGTGLNNRATRVLAAHIVKKLEVPLHHMKEGKGSSGSGSGAAGAGAAALAVVNDENKYVREIIYLLKQQLLDKAKMSIFPYLTQVIAQDFLILYYNTLRQCKFKITESTAQQMLLDLQSLKNFLVNGIPELRTRALMMQRRASVAAGTAPTLGDDMMTHGDGSSSASDAPTIPPAFKSYIKTVNTRSELIEKLLKALTAPNARLIQTYKIIFPQADHKSIFEVLTLRGLTSSEQEKLIKAYNATIKDEKQHIPILKKDFFGNLAQMARDVKNVVQA